MIYSLSCIYSVRRDVEETVKKSISQKFEDCSEKESHYEMDEQAVGEHFPDLALIPFAGVE